MAPSLEDALSWAEGVARGKVTFQTNDESHVISVFKVSEWVFGSGPAAIRITQGDGPIINYGKEQLSQSQWDPILWTGREYVLFVGKNQREELGWGLLDRGAQWEIRADGTVATPQSDSEGDELDYDTEQWTEQYIGMPVDEFLAIVREKAAVFGGTETPINLDASPAP